MKKWTSSWRYAPIDYGYEVGVFENITQISNFRNNLSGSGLRIRLNNLHSAEPMEITHGSLWLRDRFTGKKSPEYPLTLDGQTRLILPPDSAPFCDPIPCPVTWQDDIQIKLYFGAPTPIRCVCLTNAAQSWGSVHLTGDYAETEALGFTIKPKLVPGLAADPYRNQFAVGLWDISVETENDPCLVGLFGDSITHMSYFSDSLIDLLYTKYPGRCAVINAGISGNRVQKTHPVLESMPGRGAQFGIAGRDRFALHMLDGSVPDVVFLMEGVNDCSHSIVFGEPEVPTPAQIHAALLDVAAQAAAAGSQTVTSTIMPFGSFGAPWRDRVNDMRCQLNQLLRSDPPGGRLVDLDAVMRDPDRHDVMQAGMDLGDRVHPSWPGGKKMAASVAAALEGFFPGIF